MSEELEINLAVEDLIIDFGSTSIKYCFYDHKTNEVVTPMAIEVKGRTDDKIHGIVEGIIEVINDIDLFHYPNLKRIIYASVNERVKNLVVPILKETFGAKFDFIEITSKLKFSFVSNVDNPEEVGIDLLCDCEAVVFQDIKMPTIIIDLGTYTKVMFLSHHEGRHVFEGVNIGPGLKNLLKAGKIPTNLLKLPALDLLKPTSSILGKNTKESFQNGNGLMYLLMYYGMVAEILYEYLAPNANGDYDYRLFVCGGHTEDLRALMLGYEEILPLTQVSFQRRLTLEGIYAAYHTNFIKKSEDEI